MLAKEPHKLVETTEFALTSVFVKEILNFVPLPYSLSGTFWHPPQWRSAWTGAVFSRAGSHPRNGCWMSLPQEGSKNQSLQYIILILLPERQVPALLPATHSLATLSMLPV